MGSAVNAKGGFWFATYQGALNAELFIELLKKMMKGRSKPVHLVVDGLPAHKKANVRQYIESTQGKLSMHILPGYAPDLNPDEGLWNYLKRVELKNRCCRDLAELRLELRRAKERLRHKRHVIRSCSAQCGYSI